MAQDAQLISQAGQVESLASDGLVSVSTGAGQPQKNMELAKFADSLGSSVPLQQTSEQVSITGLYARTSDGKMVELTKESVASVMDELMGNPIGTRRTLTGEDDINNINQNGVYPFYQEVGLPSNMPNGIDRGCLVVFANTVHAIQMLESSTITLIRVSSVGGWGDWRRIDNFGYNTLAELSSGVAEQITRATTGTIGSYVLGWVRIAKWNTTGYYDGIAATITLRGVWGDNPAGTGAMKFDVAVSYPNNFKIGNVVGVNKFTRARLVVEDGATWLDVYAGNAGGGVIVNIQNYGFGPVTFSLKQVLGDASDGVPLYNN